MGVRYARLFGLPLVFTYHTQLEEYAHYVPFERTATKRAASTLTRTYANLADAVIVPTVPMEDRLRALGVTSPIAVVPTGINVDQFRGGRRDSAWRSALGVGPGERVVLLVSRLAREKNIELAFAGLAALGDPGAHLVLAGDGPARSALVAAAKAAGMLDRTHFLGHVPREALPGVYASADAFLFPSRTETQGLVLAEALIAGLPVVAVDTPATRDVLGDAGHLVAPDPRALATALRGVLDAHRGRQSAAPLALSRFSLEAQARKVVDVYETLLAERRTA